MESSGLKVEKLRDKDNWTQWRFVIRTLLEDDDDMLEACEGKLVCPIENEENYENKLKKFKKADKAARKLIVTTVEKKPLDLLLSCTTASEMWQKLNAVYDLKSEENLSLVQKQFFELKWEVSESVAHNLSKVEQLGSKMKSLGSKVPDSMLLSRILSILPSKFYHFHSAWDSVDETKKTIDNLTARLMSEEMRMHNHGIADEENIALVTKSKPANSKQFSHQKGNKDFNGKKNHNVTCYNCGKKGHFKKDCLGCYTCGAKGHLSRNCFKRKDVQNGDSRNAAEAEKREALLVSSKDVDNDFWVIDSGASDHMTNHREWFSSYEEFNSPINIKMGNGDGILAYGKGNIEIQTCVRNDWIDCTLHDVLYVPMLKGNLFSVKVVAKKGVDFSIANNGKQCIFTRGNKVIATGSDSGNLYKINSRVLLPKNCNLSNKTGKSMTGNVRSLQVWHERLCHQNKKHVKVFLQKSGINFINDDDFCEGCVYGKQHRSAFHNRIERATKVREIIHADVCGPMETESLGRKFYFLILKDDFSSFRKIYFLRNKSEVFEKLKEFCLEVINQFKDRIKEIHTDGGREFMNKEVKEFLKSKGIKHSVNVPYTPEQNGIAERENRTIVEAAKSMIYSKSDLPLFLWAEAMNTAVYVINKTGPCKIENKSPHELWYGKSANIENLKIFGTECFVHIPAQKRRKLDRKAVKGFLVGYVDDFRGYRIYLPNSRDVVSSRDVQFKPENVSFKEADVGPLKVINREKDVENIGKDINENLEDKKENEKVAETVNENGNVRELRSRDKIRPPQYYGCPIAFLAESLPQTYSEAVNSSDKDLWVEAMKDEVSSLHENKTWELVEKPESQKVISSRWIFTKKFNSDGSERFKARLVIRGFLQTKGIDYKETFSPVVRFETIRFLLSVAACNNMHLGQFDVKTAFLYGNLNENIYMEQPEGFKDGTTRVCKLLKSLYGLKQAPRCWTELFSDFAKHFGFCQSTADPCLFIYTEDDKRMYLTIYVDDGLVAASDECLIDKLFNDLRKEFKITDTKNVTNFLGLEINRLNDGSIFLNQNKYILSILERFNLINANSVSTPIETGWEAGKLDKICNVPYREAVGSLIFLHTGSRPDISFAVNVASRVLDKPCEEHWMLVKRIMRYLKGTADVGLLYKKNGKCEVYSDADYAGDKETRKSTSGIVCMNASAAIIWQSKRQQCVSLSTTEAEYVSAASAAKEMVWLRKLFVECKLEIVDYTLHIDNMSALRLIKNPEFHQRSKHIDVKYHFIRDLYNKKEIDIKYVRSEDQTADIFTKALAKPRFVFLMEKLGLCSKRSIENLLL